MKIYICDDELQIQVMIKECVDQFFENHPSQIQTRIFSLGRELLEAYREQPCDIVLLDIDLPEMNGMEVAEQLDSLEKNGRKPLLVFVTAHDEFVYDSFLYHPFGFVRKSFLEQELTKLLGDCEKELRKREKHFFFRAEGKECKLFLTDILYLESDGNYLVLYTTGENYRFRGTITEYYAQLGQNGFIRVHKGFLVNQAAVRAIGSEKVELNNGNSVPMGKNYAKEAKVELMRYMRA